jgi:hypothetical protein
MVIVEALEPQRQQTRSRAASRLPEEDTSQQMVVSLLIVKNDQLRTPGPRHRVCGVKQTTTWRFSNHGKR